MWNPSKSPPEGDQPRAFDPSVPRRAPDLPFPPYRHLPGQTPHPHTHPDGHSYQRETACDSPALRSENWQSNRAYLFGTDLYNYAYWWEAHEQWEVLWHLAGRHSLCGQYLQGLIQTAAAFIKWHQGNQRGRDKLWEQGRHKLVEVLDVQEVYMGLDLVDFLQRTGQFFCGCGNAAPMNFTGGNVDRAPLLHLRTVHIRG